MTPPDCWRCGAEVDGAGDLGPDDVTYCPPCRSALVLPCAGCDGYYGPTYTAPMTGAAVRECPDCGTICAYWDDDDLTEPPTPDPLADEVAQYVATALWSSTDEEGDPLDCYLAADDLAPEALEAARSAVADFVAAHPDECRHWSATYGAGQIGHDLWLTRNGHGTGFRDRGAGPIGETLADAARSLGESDAYVGDDGAVLFS